MSSQADWWGTTVQGCSVKAGRGAYFVECTDTNTDIKKKEESGKNVTKKQDKSSETDHKEKGAV